MRLKNIQYLLILSLSGLMMASTMTGCCGGGDDAKVESSASDDGGSKSSKKKKKKDKKKKKKDKKRAKKDKKSKKNKLTPTEQEWTEQMAEYDDSTGGLRKYVKAIYSAHEKGKVKKAEFFANALAMPDHDAWFAKTFGDDVGSKLSEEYSVRVATDDFGEKFAGMMGEQIAKGRTDIKTFKVKNAEDKDANGAQKAAMGLMKERRVLYTVKLIKPGEERGMSLWSFVHAKGQWRFLGKMRAAK